MLQQTFETAARSTIIKDFISEFGRVPERGELNDLITELYKTNSPGLEGVWRKKPLNKINEESSVSKENEFLEDHKTNIDYSLDYLNEFYYKLFNNSLSNQLALSYLEKKYISLDSALSAVLIDSSLTSSLIGLIVEDFSSTEKILSFDGISISPGMVYSDYSSITSSEITYDLSYRINCPNYISLNQNGTLDSLKEIDNQYWSVDLATRDPAVRSDLILDLDFDLHYVGLMKIQLMSANSLCTVQTSVDGDTWIIVGSAPVDTGLVLMTIDSTVSKIRIIISKTYYDYVDSSYHHVFKVDAIDLLESLFEASSTISSGPYQILDCFGESLDFSYIKFESCATKPEKTDISFYVSTDNSNWIPISEATTVLLNSAGAVDDYVLIDSDKKTYELDDANTDGLTLLGNQVPLNIKLPISYLDKIDLKSILIKRNMPGNYRLWDVDSGWFYDDNGNYSTTIQVDNPEGLVLDFGFTTGVLDGMNVSGSVFVSPGIHRFKTSQANWIEIDENLLTESAIKSQDPLYPYNHKYIIEGYAYPLTYSGNQIYSGVTEFFGAKLKYSDAAEFEQAGYEDYSIVTSGDYIYFIVNTNKSYEDWTLEQVETIIYSNDDSNDEIYVKADLISYDQINFPILHSWTIKAI